LPRPEKTISRPTSSFVYRESGKKLDRFTTQTVASPNIALERAAPLWQQRHHSAREPPPPWRSARPCATSPRRAFDHGPEPKGWHHRRKQGQAKATQWTRPLRLCRHGRLVIGSRDRRVVEKMESDGFTEAKTIHKIHMGLKRGKETSTRNGLHGDEPQW